MCSAGFEVYILGQSGTSMLAMPGLELNVKLACLSLTHARRML